MQKTSDDYNFERTHPHHEYDCICVDCMKDIYAPTRVVEVDDYMRELIGWRGSLALDDWGDGLSYIIQQKLKNEIIFFKDGKSDRIPEHLISTFAVLGDCEPKKVLPNG
jgi:hypothetical protein